MLEHIGQTMSNLDQIICRIASELYFKGESTLDKELYYGNRSYFADNLPLLVHRDDRSYSVVLVIPDRDSDLIYLELNPV